MSKAVVLLMILVAIATALVPSTASSINDALSIPSGAWKDLLTLVNAHRGDSKAAIIELKAYFAKFGYLGNTTSTSMEFDEMLERAVRLYQQNFKLEVTGTLNAATIAQLLKPRCGREDVLDGISQMLQSEGTTNRSLLGVEHYSFFRGRPKWTSTRSLRYYFDETSLSKIGNVYTPAEVKAAFRSGFAKWSAVVPLKFSETTSSRNADITIDFADFDHGDNNAFDGPGGVLAHAFAPEDGRFHLDASEEWLINLGDSRSVSAFHLESVTIHEIGHLIGLGHSGVAEAIMFPTFGPRKVKTALAPDDIQGAQLLYGATPGSDSRRQSPPQGVDSSLEASGAKRVQDVAALFASIAIVIAQFF